MTKLKYHIIQVIADPGPGGAPTHVLGLIKELKNLAPEAVVSLISPAGWLTAESKTLCSVYPTPITSAVGRTSHQVFRVALKKAIDIYPELPAIVHFHGVRAGTLGYLNFRYRGRGKSTPMVYTEHLWTRDYHLDSRLREMLQLQLLSGVGHRATKVIAVSNAVATFLLEKKLVSPERLVVIPNGVELPKTTHSYRNQPPYTVGSIGSLVPLKGYKTLLEAFSQVGQKADVNLKIIGDGPEKTNLAKLIEKLHLGDQAQLLGQIKEPATELANWDILVSTSLSESFGLSVAEAMSYGIPVIATHVGGLPELVTPETGRLVPPRDPAMLARVISELLSDPKLCERLGKAGRKRIETDFTLRQMAERVIDIYRQIAAPKQ